MVMTMTNNKVEFSEWKRKLLMKLISIASESNNDEERKTLDALINELRYLRFRDVSGFIADLWVYCNYFKKYEICKEATVYEITE